MAKILIIDGHNLLFQMYFGMPSRIINKEGKAIHGTLGFVGALLKIICITEPTHLVVLFDGEHENGRTELDAQYKANRSEDSRMLENDSPFSQIDDLYSALDFMKIKHTEIAELETDDVIASYAFTYGKNNKIVISSFDSDFFQLINENVSVLRYRGDRTVICDHAYIQDKLGIEPLQYADFKAFTGDASDNIKGADKIGPKTAAALINEFGSLESIIVNAEKITKPSIKKSVMRNRERLRTNYKLIKLTERANIPFDIETLEYRYNGITTSEVLTAIGLR